jgi:hypothetical protein
MHDEQEGNPHPVGSVEVHGKPHEHGHEHHHDHEHGAADDPAKILSVLGYMLEHNKSHAGDLAELAHKLRHADNDAAADLIGVGVKDFEAGNGKLEEALNL